jgi:WD40 repeat protein
VALGWSRLSGEIIRAINLDKGTIISWDAKSLVPTYVFTIGHPFDIKAMDLSCDGSVLAAVFILV